MKCGMIEIIKGILIELGHWNFAQPNRAAPESFTSHLDLDARQVRVAPVQLTAAGDAAVRRLGGRRRKRRTFGRLTSCLSALRLATGLRGRRSRPLSAAGARRRSAATRVRSVRRPGGRLPRRLSTVLIPARRALRAPPCRAALRPAAGRSVDGLRSIGRRAGPRPRRAGQRRRRRDAADHRLARRAHPARLATSVR